MAVRIAIAGAVLTAVAFVAWLQLRGNESDAVAPTDAPALPAAATTNATAPVREAAPVAPPTPVSPPAAGGETWLLPDGTRVPALNGATGAKPLSEAWPRDVPYSPIVRTERTSAGVDWYVHADGSRSTTEMKWRADLGRSDAVTRLARPTPTAPVAPVPANQPPAR
jgi:hypothetical protein